LRQGVADKKDFLLRLNQQLWQELQAWAADELRSVNGQMEYLLREAVRQHRRSITDDDPSKKKS